ncbi:MAG: DUF2298 domain-containing protein, partial [Candidatus Shapirobacteria bacterium]
ADLTLIFSWWFLIFTLGLISLPFTFFIFQKFWDKGYLFSKIISLVISTYLIFVGGVFKILTFTKINILLILLLLFFINIFFLRQKNNFKLFLKTIKEKSKIFLFEEILFFSILVIWSLIRAFNPSIEGLEKFMDWGFINSILRSNFLPATDMWFSGETINYYYFGHIIFAVLTKLSNISSSITYNLSIATVAALTFSFAFSLSSNLAFVTKKIINIKKVIIIGFISAMILSFGGNLHPIYKIIKINIKENSKLTLTKKAIIESTNKYWYPDATRFIGHDPDIKDKTIHEFPVYSFVVADLHGHMNDIPIILFFMAFLLASSFYTSSLINYFVVIVSGFTLSISYMTNAWDFAIYGLLFAIFTLFLNLKDNSKLAIKKTLINGFFTILIWFIFSLPFSLSFTPIGEGVKISDSHSPFYQLFILYGGFWLIILPFIFLLIKKIKNKNWKLKIENSDLFVLAAILTATILIIIPEIIYLKDIYIYEHRRANTMFKLTYQAFIMYSLVSGYVFYKTKSLLKKRLSKFLYLLLFFLIFSIHLIYPYFAIKSFYFLNHYQSLWGLNYLKDNYPSNLEAIDWINKNIPGQPVMLEAVGDSYTTFNQISVATGLPTVQGWIVHEWLWRGGYDKPKARQDDVQKIYESEDLNRLKNLIKKYNINYIFVGDKEYEKYPDINEKNFIDIGGQIIFQSGKTKIYQL